jgi:hypothetical protein
MDENAVLSSNLCVNQKAERIPKWEIFGSALVFEPMRVWLTAEMKNGPFEVI